MLRPKVHQWLALALVPMLAEAQELRPSDSVLRGIGFPPEYTRALQEAFVFPDQPQQCALVAVPSFTPEWSVYVARSGGGSVQLVSKRFRKHLYPLLLPPPPPPPLPGAPPPTHTAKAVPSPPVSPADLVETASIAIAPDLAELLHRVWWAMLGRVTYATPGQGNDGVMYFVSDYSFDAAGGYRAGTAWSPARGPSADLVRLAEQMAELARAGGVSERSALEQAIRLEAVRLLQRLQ